MGPLPFKPTKSNFQVLFKGNLPIFKADWKIKHFSRQYSNSSTFQGLLELCPVTDLACGLLVQAMTIPQSQWQRSSLHQPVPHTHWEIFLAHIGGRVHTGEETEVGVTHDWLSIAERNGGKTLSLESLGPCINIKTVFPRYGDSHVKDKTVARPSYL